MLSAYLKVRPLPLLLASILAFSQSALAFAQDRGGASQAEVSTWEILKPDLFGEKQLVEDGTTIQLEAPKRAADAAIVPMTITLDPAKKIRKVSLVIDENPAPLAAEFDLAPGADLTKLSTRVRVNAYSDVHVVGEAEDGTLYMAKRFVKAAGGCADRSS